MRIGYKTNTTQLFVPQKDSTYRTWYTPCKSALFESVLAGDIRTFVLVDPPERDDSVLARMIKFASNEESTHYPNFSKDGHPRFTPMPTVEEMVAMIAVLWNEGTAFPNQ